MALTFNLPFKTTNKGSKRFSQVETKVQLKDDSALKWSCFGLFGHCSDVVRSECEKLSTLIIVSPM